MFHDKLSLCLVKRHITLILKIFLLSKLELGFQNYCSVEFKCVIFPYSEIGDGNFTGVLLTFEQQLIQNNASAL